MFAAVFLDRDGVIIENRDDYVRSWDDVDIYPQALRALAWASPSAYKFVIVTNQSVVGRGLIRHVDMDAINQRLIDEIKRAGGRIDGVYVCPHAPSDFCACRKPEPGLILTAAHEMDLDLRRSILIGDAITDIQAGLSAGVGQLALVRTGRGSKQEKDVPPAQIPGLAIFETLEGALTAFLDQAEGDE